MNEHGKATLARIRQYTGEGRSICGCPACAGQWLAIVDQQAAEIARLRAALEAARIEHDADCSVHATPPGVKCGRCGYVDCGQEFGVCDCGAAEHNAAIDKALRITFEESEHDR